MSETREQPASLLLDVMMDNCGTTQDARKANMLATKMLTATRAMRRHAVAVTKRGFSNASPGRTDKMGVRL